MIQINILADFLAQSSYDQNESVRYLNKFVKYFMVVRKYYKVEDEKYVHLKFKKFLSFQFLLLTNREKVQTLEFDFIN